MSPEDKVLVIDASVLSPFARAERLEDLERITRGYDRVTVNEVLAELRMGSLTYPALLAPQCASWLSTVPTDTLPVLNKFAKYRRRFGPGPRDVGEAAVLAWAELNGAQALIDDQTAHDIGVSRGIIVRRSLGLLATRLQASEFTEREAEDLVDALRAADARLPWDGTAFLAWCRKSGFI